MSSTIAGASTVPGLADLQDWASEQEKSYIQLLLEEDQHHLFSGWKTHADVEKKHAFCDQIRALEGGYPGGLRAYLRNARSLLRSSAAGENPFEGMKPEVPSGAKLDYASDAFMAAEEAGLRVFANCAFVLVAGGLGERLGYTDIKVSLPVETTTERCYLELYVQQLLAMQDFANRMNGTHLDVPLAIMTSDDTHQRTVDLLRRHSNFGMKEGQITIIKQEKVAALLDNDAHIALEESDPYSIDTKPHGHGDVHTLLASSGLAKKWDGEGRKYVVFFQDTNSLAFTVTQAAIGVSLQNDFEVNSVTVPRKAKDAVGAIARLVKADGSSITVNVEYNQLEPLLKASGYKDGDVNDASGFSPFPGNINQLVFKIAPYARVLERTGGLVPEFVNPKYADATKTKFKKPTRLECMMQDHPKVLGPDAKVGFTNFEEWTYLPVKNSVDEARSKIMVGAPGRTAAEGELDYYDAGCRMLQSIGAAVADAGTLDVFGFKLRNPAHIVFHPNFAVSSANFRSKFINPAAVKISQRSTLYLEGPDIRIDHLDLDGALIVKAVPGAKVVIKKLNVRNAGWNLTPLSESDTVSDGMKIRGFKIAKDDQRVLEFTAPGEYVIEE